MTESTVAPIDRSVTVGVDTHSNIYVAVALDQLGRRLGTTTIPTTPEGYQQLESWARQLGEVDAFGIEGAGSWGASLVRLLRERGYRLIEVNCPDRGARHRQGMNDPLDAEAAARAVFAGTATARPKAGQGAVEMIRSLQVATAAPRRPAPRRPTRSGLCWSPHRPRSASSCARPRSPSWSAPPAAGAPAPPPTPTCS